MRRITILLTFIVLALADAVLAGEEGRPVGVIKTATGEALVLRAGHRIAARPGQQLAMGDTLATGATGAMGAILRDDTLLTIGPSTEIRIEQFAFEPAEGKLAVVVRVARGIIDYVSGRIAKLAPGAARLETPVATLGVRGTHLVARIVP
jgi:hypothetical protein